MSDHSQTFYDARRDARRYDPFVVQRQANLVEQRMIDGEERLVEYKRPTPKEYTVHQAVTALQDLQPISMHGQTLTTREAAILFALGVRTMLENELRNVRGEKADAELTEIVVKLRGLVTKQPALHRFFQDSPAQSRLLAAYRLALREAAAEEGSPLKICICGAPITGSVTV